MRALLAVIAVAGGASAVLAIALHLESDDYQGAGWVLVGPLPFYLVSLLAYLRRPGHPAAAWMLVSGASFAIDVFLGDALIPRLAGWSGLFGLVLVREWVGLGSVVAGLGFLGLFPVGRPERRYERRVLVVAAVSAALLPILLALTRPVFTTGLFPSGGIPVVPSPIYSPLFAPLGPAATAYHVVFPLWTVVGLVLLALRYRRGGADMRRRIRWVLVGSFLAFALWVPLSLLPERSGARVAILILWPVILSLFIGPFVLAIFHDGVFGIDRPARRSAVSRVLWSVIAILYVTTVAGLGMLASRRLPVEAAVLLAVGASLLFLPVRRWLERLADEWVFGARLDGYALLSRFGTILETSPRPTELLQQLAESVHRGLGLTWVRVRLAGRAAMAELPEGVAGVVPEDASPAVVVPLVYDAKPMGTIECGPRREGAFLEEDRRVLGYLSHQAAAAVHNLYLSAELSEQLTVIRRQAAELTASRERLAQGRDAERRRIQRDLHDGVQQEVVALTAKLGLARQQLRRGDSRAGGTLAELSRDLGALLADIREFAYAIHPPVLSDQGLLEAVEAQASRLPLAMVVQADPALRGIRYPPDIEAASWYVVSEALTNVVKHADARNVVVSLEQPDHELVVEVRDDGRGFDPASNRGLGLAGLADRMAIVGGTLAVHSTAGRGTTLRANIPLSDVEGVHA